MTDQELFESFLPEEAMSLEEWKIECLKDQTEDEQEDK
jgi:hypothetical protein